MKFGLISVPLNGSVAAGTWPKYVASSCNNMIKFSVPCLGEATPPTISLAIEPQEISNRERARLCWKATSDGALQIDQGIGKVTSENCIRVTPSADSSWHATIRSCGGEARSQVSLTAKAKLAPPPPNPHFSPIS